MKLIIKNIVLYPRNQELEPQVIKFEPGKVNVITGYSQRGKSAIIQIIDYCLGSHDCNIPIGKIRTLVDKVAIDISLNKGNLFIARDIPIGNAKTHMYYESYEKETTFSFKEWRKDADDFKTNREEIKNYLGTLAGFENVQEKEESASGFDAPASFRDTTAFQFQPQSIIANPATTFYNMDSFEHLKRLRSLFPLVLGYKSYEIIKIENEIEGLQKIEKEKQNKLDDLLAQYENWQEDIYRYYTRAIQLGLTNSDFNVDSSKVDEIKTELSNIVTRVKGGSWFSDGSTLRYTEKLDELEIDRNNIIRRLDDLKTNLLKIEQFDRSKQIYVSEVAKEIETRLKPIDWFLDLKGTNMCPFCDSYSDKAITELLNLNEEKLQNREVLIDAISKDFSFEKEKAHYKKEIIISESSLKRIETNIRILINQNRESSERISTVYEFAGKIEHVIENLNKISPSSELSVEIEKLRNDLAAKRASLKKLQAKFNKEQSLTNVTKSIDTYVQLLPIEDKENRKVLLDPDISVNIRILDTKTNDKSFLSKLGSGANHMGFHLATILGLHEYFYKLPQSSKKNYVPSFIVIDQPSQVYFPEGFPEESGTSKKTKEKISEDILNTTAIFKACSTFMTRTSHEVQVIILEHAPQSTWKDIDDIHLVDEWRGELQDETSNFRALLPKEWISI